MKTFTSLFLIILSFINLQAQNEEIEAIRISTRRGHLSSRTLEFKVEKGTFTFQKKVNKKVKPVDVDSFGVFNDTNIISGIKQMFDTFGRYQPPCNRKPKIYRVELVYKTSNPFGAYSPRKIKTYDFALSYYRSVCETEETDILDDLIIEYWRIRYKYKLKGFLW